MPILCFYGTQAIKKGRQSRCNRSSFRCLNTCHVRIPIRRNNAASLCTRKARACLVSWCCSLLHRRICRILRRYYWTLAKEENSKSCPTWNGCWYRIYLDGNSGCVRYPRRSNDWASSSICSNPWSIWWLYVPKADSTTSHRYRGRNSLCAMSWPYTA